MKRIDLFSNGSFTKRPLLRTLALSIGGKLFMPLSLYKGIFINGSIECLTLCVEKTFSRTRGQAPSEKMKVCINGAITTAALATLFFSTLLYPSISATVIGGVSIKLLALRILLLFCQTIAMSVFTNKIIGLKTDDKKDTKTDSKEDFLRHLDEWVEMSGFEENHVLAKQRICEFFASHSSTLDLDNLNLGSLPDVFNDPRFNQLQQLILGHNRLTTLPESLGQLRGLKKLRLDYYNLTTLPDSVGQLQALEDLYLSSDKLITLPDSLGQLRGLKKLRLDCYNLTTLPDSVGQLRGLKKLRLDCYNLTTLPDSVGQLQALEDLYLSSDKLITLPDSLGQLRGLKKLRLDCYNLTTLPDSVGQLQALEDLDLSSKKLITLPDSLSQLRGLKKLSLYCWNLTTLPESLGQLRGLEKLFLAHNNLTMLPESLGRLQGLKELSLRDTRNRNDAVTLPNSLCQLQALKILRLLSWNLTTLADSVSQLQALELLDLSDNKLTTLPDSLCQLQALKTLRLYRNRTLSGISHSILQLSPNCEVDLTGCGLSANVLERLREATEAESYSGPRIMYAMFDVRTGVEEKSIKKSLEDLYAIIDKPPEAFTNLEESPELKSWLNRLADTADYKSSQEVKKPFAEQIIDYLKQANDDAEFRAIFYQIIADASITCGDRVALSILHLSIAHKLATIDLKNMKHLENFLVKGPWTIEMLEAAAREKVETLPFFDEIEVYLGYPIQLKGVLQIPIDVENMLYFSCSALTEKDLEEAKYTVLKQRNDPEKRLDFLVNHPTWEKALELNYPQEYRAIFNQRDKSSKQRNPDYDNIYKTFKQGLKALTEKALST